MNDLFPLLGLGRIQNIIHALKTYYNVESISELSVEVKLKALCLSIGLNIKQFDSMIANNSPVLRTVKGHAFEVTFERILTYNNIQVSDVGGDSDIDLQVFGHTLQLKTPNLGGSTNTDFEYKTHKTHGAKSERESMDYYHKVDNFADFFVGLISYSPFRVFILPKEKLPKHPLDNKYIISPFKLSLSGGLFEEESYVNAFNLLGITLNDFSLSSIINSNNELLPLTSSAIGIKTEIILDTILRECNFRIWDMSIRGFAREVALKSFFDNNGITYSDTPTKYREERGDKADLVIFSNNSQNIFIQVKGISTNNCTFNQKESIIDTETQLTRGRVNDHPTQSRLYLVSDFEFLILAVEPTVTYNIENNKEWVFFMIPTSILNKHSQMPHRLSSIQKFKWKDLESYRLKNNQYILKSIL